MALVTERAAGSSGLCKVSKQVSIVKPTRCTNVSNFTVHTARVPAPHSHSHHYQCRTPYAAVHTIVLMMMGIMMPETCWDSLIINIRFVASCWFLSLHPKSKKNSSQTVRSKEVGTHRLSRNVGNSLIINVCVNHRSSNISTYVFFLLSVPNNIKSAVYFDTPEPNKTTRDAVTQRANTSATRAT